MLYVESLIGPDTVNTLPPATFTAFRDHGKVRLTIEENLDEAKKTLEKLAEVGVDLKQVCQKLQDDGVKAFADSFESLMQSITSEAGRADQRPARQNGGLIWAGTKRTSRRPSSARKANNGRAKSVAKTRPCGKMKSVSK